MEMPGAPRALREQGRRSFGFFYADFFYALGCLKCESESKVRARPRHSIPPRFRGGWPSESEVGWGPRGAV